MAYRDAKGRFVTKASHARSQAARQYWRAVREIQRVSGTTPSVARASYRQLAARDITTAAAVRRHPRITQRAVSDRQLALRGRKPRQTPDRRRRERHDRDVVTRPRPRRERDHAIADVVPAVDRGSVADIPRNLSVDDWIARWDDGDFDDYPDEEIAGAVDYGEDE